MSRGRGIDIHQRHLDTSRCIRACLFILFSLEGRRGWDAEARRVGLPLQTSPLLSRIFFFLLVFVSAPQIHAADFLRRVGSADARQPPLEDFSESSPGLVGLRRSNQRRNAQVSCHCERQNWRGQKTCK